MFILIGYSVDVFVNSLIIFDYNLFVVSLYIEFFFFIFFSVVFNFDEFDFIEEFSLGVRVFLNVLKEWKGVWLCILGYSKKYFFLRLD